MAVPIVGQCDGESAFGGAQTGPNPTDRGKSGTKRHVLTDARGAPLAVTITAANRHDMKAAFSTLEAVVTPRPPIKAYHLQHLCLDKGYDYPEIHEGVCDRGYLPHIRRRGERKLEAGERRHPARRWVVERTNSWHNRFRKLAVRFEKKVENYLALVHISCCLITYRLILG
jgi:putative transposase